MKQFNDYLTEAYNDKKYESQIGIAGNYEGALRQT